MQEGTYAIENGRIKTRSLEAHIVDHCNLRCAGCCSLSPLLPKAITAPKVLAHDLALASKVLAPTWFKLVGGEPLLHPEIDACLEVTKNSHIAPIISVTTNGFLLPKMSELFWQLIDALTVSLYPTPALPQKTIALIQAQAAQHGIPVNWKKQDSFVDMDRAIVMEDVETNRRVFAKCWLRRRCHLVRQARFFTCTRSVHFHTLQHSMGGSADFLLQDGISLEPRPTLVRDLLAYLTRDKPLAACARCQGGHADKIPHRQMTLHEVRSVLSTVR